MFSTVWVSMAEHTFNSTLIWSGMDSQYRCIYRTYINYSHIPLDVAALSIAGFWAVFFNAILIGMLQESRDIEKSAVFLFQQTLFIQLPLIGLIINNYVNSFLIHNEDNEEYNNKYNFETDKFGGVLLILQQLLFCFYVGLRLYLTYRRDETMVVFFAYKVFLFIVIAGITFGVYFGAIGSDVGFTNVATIVIPIVTFACLFTLACRRNRQQNKIQQRTLWIFFLSNLSNVVSRTVLINNDDYNFYQVDFITEHKCTLKQKNNIYYVFMIICPSFSAFASSVSDIHLRKTFLQIFNLEKCFATRTENRGDEDKPLIGPYEEQNDDNRPRQQVPSNWQTHLYGAHQTRYESDYRTIPHESLEHNVSNGAHKENLDIGSNFRAMPHEPPEYDVTKGAHKDDRDIETNVRAMPHQAPLHDMTRGAHVADERKLSSDLLQWHINYVDRKGEQGDDKQ